MGEPVAIRNAKAISREGLFDPDRLRRTLRSSRCTLLGELTEIYFYEPVTLEERAAARRSVTLDANGELHQHIDRWVDVVIARVRDETGKPVFFTTDRKRLLNWPADDVQALVMALGAGTEDELGLEELTDEAGKD